MKQAIKYELLKMLIPIIGTWWVISRILPGSGGITWWDTSSKALPTVFMLVFYQGICWIGLKVFYMMYFFDYTFEQVFIQ